jgi:hypothetical protein
MILVAVVHTKALRQDAAGALSPVPWIWLSAPEGGGTLGARTLGLRVPGGGGGSMKKHETTSTVLLKHHLKALKLPTMTAYCEKPAARCAKEDVDHLGFLLQLLSWNCWSVSSGQQRAAARGGAVPGAQGVGRV